MGVFIMLSLAVFSLLFICFEPKTKINQSIDQLTRSATSSVSSARPRMATTAMCTMTKTAPQ